jgi:arylsulfatase A-like enzyme
MLTGLPPHKHGAKRNGLSIYGKIKTFPQFLKRCGYRTAAVVSNWPLRKKLSKLHTGFDVYYEIFTKKRYMGLMNPEGGAPAVTRKTLEWLKNKPKQPFFLWVQFTDPHALYNLHKGFTFDYRDVKSSLYPPGTRMKKIKKYDSEIAFTDHHIGIVLAELKDMGLYDDALIIFHADHGESFGEHNYFKHGRKLFNSTLHVPLVIKLPGNRLKNTRRTENVSILDIGRTIFSILELPMHPQMEGIALFEESEIPELATRRITFQTYGGAVTFRRNDKKYKLKVKPVKYGILQNSSKLILNPKAKTYEVYNLDEDPFEIKNIFSGNQLPWKGMQEELTDNIKEIKKYIKLKRTYEAGNRVISKEDMIKLKSLGYIED